MKATKFFSPTSVVHYVRPPQSTTGHIRGYLVLHCTGRAMRDLATVPDDTRVTCKACTAKAARDGGVPE